MTSKADSYVSRLARINRRLGRVCDDLIAVCKDQPKDMHLKQATGTTVFALGDLIKIELEARGVLGAGAKRGGVVIPFPGVQL